MKGLTWIENIIEESYARDILSLLPRQVTLPSVTESESVVQDSSASLQWHCFRPLPDVINFVSEDVIPGEWKDQVWQGQECDCAIVQKYRAGEGIRYHVDLDRFQDGVAILSLLSTVRMHFRHTQDHSRVFDLVLRPNSLLLMSLEARYEWEHCIENVDYDVIDGVEVKRGDRISITMRRLRMTSEEE